MEKTKETKKTCGFITLDLYNTLIEQEKEIDIKKVKRLALEIEKFQLKNKLDRIYFLLNTSTTFEDLKPVLEIVEKEFKSLGFLPAPHLCRNGFVEKGKLLQNKFPDLDCFYKFQYYFPIIFKIVECQNLELKELIIVDDLMCNDPKEHASTTIKNKLKDTNVTFIKPGSSKQSYEDDLIIVQEKNIDGIINGFKKKNRKNGFSKSKLKLDRSREERLALQYKELDKMETEDYELYPFIDYDPKSNPFYKYRKTKKCLFCIGYMLWIKCIKTKFIGKVSLNLLYVKEPNLMRTLISQEFSQEDMKNKEDEYSVYDMIDILNINPLLAILNDGYKIEVINGEYHAYKKGRHISFPKKEDVNYLKVYNSSDSQSYETVFVVEYLLKKYKLPLFTLIDTILTYRQKINKELLEITLRKESIICHDLIEELLMNSLSETYQKLEKNDINSAQKFKLEKNT